MKARYQLVERSLAMLSLASWAAIALRVARDTPTADLVPNIGFGVLFGLGWIACRAGFARAAAWIVSMVACSLGLVLTATDHGAASHFAIYLPLGGIALWVWVGSRVAGMYVLACAAVLLGGGAPPSLDHGFDVVLAHVLTVVLGAGIVGVSAHDLRSAVESSWAEAQRAEQAAQDAMAADAARQGFLDLVSHRLSDPLDAVVRDTERLRDSEADPARLRDLERIGSAGRQLRHLVQDLLDMSNVDDDNLRVVGQVVDLGRLLVDVCDVVEPPHSDKPVEVRLDVPDDLPPVIADEVRVRQIVANLMVNALKYTERGSVTLSAGADGSTVWVEVADTGVGIPSHRLGELFQPFVQLHEGTDRRPGVGLGLALSQRLAQRMGGRIDARSTLGKGSTFRLVLPQGLTAAAEPAP